MVQLRKLSLPHQAVGHASAQTGAAATSITGGASVSKMYHLPFLGARRRALTRTDGCHLLGIYIYIDIIIYIQNIACPADFVVSCSSCFNGNRQLPRKLIPSPKIPVGAKCPAFPTFQTISKVSVSMSQAQIALRKCLNFKTSMKSPQKNPTEIP